MTVNCAVRDMFSICFGYVRDNYEVIDPPKTNNKKPAFVALHHRLPQFLLSLRPQRALQDALKICTLSVPFNSSFTNFLSFLGPRCLPAVTTPPLPSVEGCRPSFRIVGSVGGYGSCRIKKLATYETYQAYEEVNSSSFLHLPLQRRF